VGADEGESFARHEKNRLEIGMEAAVGQSELKFIFEIGYGTKASDHGDRFFLSGKFDKESPEGGDLNLGGPRFVADTVL
jgi:hypothetical protein